MHFALLVVPVLADLVPLAETPTPTAQVITEAIEISPKIIKRKGNPSLILKVQFQCIIKTRSTTIIPKKKALYSKK